MQTAFERLIADLPADSSVMDVGYGGLGGENTTDYLRARFGTIEGLCKQEDAVQIYKKEKGAKDEVKIGFYPEDMPEKQYDLLVLDTNIEGNLAFWSEEGMKKAWSYVKPGGHIITYVMLTDFYGEEETQEMIRKHREEWWAKEPALPIVRQEHEERRFYISWVLLKKLNDSGTKTS